MMKRYLVFGSSKFFSPIGGWCNYHGSLDDLAAAESLARAKAGLVGWGHVVDRDTGQIVWSTDRC